MINSFDAARSAIEADFKTTWDTDDAPLIWPNTRQNPPSTGSYIKFNMINGAGSNAAVGGLLQRYLGQVQVQVFVKKGTSAVTAYQLADLVVSAFVNKQLDSITFRVPEVVEVGEMNEFFQINVVCPFYRNSVVA